MLLFAKVPFRVLFVGLFLWPMSVLADPARVVLLIDDLGFQYELDQTVLQLDPRVNVAIIPGTPGARRLGQKAYEQGRGVLIHLPLSGLGHDDCDSGLLQCLDADWSGYRMDAFLETAFGEVPSAIGVNNHQGSRFTAEYEAVVNLVASIQRLGQRQGRALLVLDSRTTPQSRLESAGLSAGLPTLRRHVFLDHQDDLQSIESAWKQLIDRARRDGMAVGIGHPRATTLAFLDQALRELDDDLVLINLSEMPQPSWHTHSNSRPGP